jgi:hypothetical protein
MQKSHSHLSFKKCKFTEVSNLKIREKPKFNNKRVSLNTYVFTEFTKLNVEKQNSTYQVHRLFERERERETQPTRLGIHKPFSQSG